MTFDTGKNRRTSTHLQRRFDALLRTIDALPVGSRLAVVREARGFRFYIEETQRRTTGAAIPVAQPIMITIAPVAIDKVKNKE